MNLFIYYIKSCLLTRFFFTERYVGIAMLIVGFLVLFGSMIYCIVVCRETEHLRAPPGEYYWTNHWTKTVNFPELHYSNTQYKPAEYKGSEFSFKTEPSRTTAATSQTRYWWYVWIDSLYRYFHYLFFLYYYNRSIIPFNILIDSSVYFNIEHYNFYFRINIIKCIKLYCLDLCLLENYLTKVQWIILISIFCPKML